MVVSSKLVYGTAAEGTAGRTVANHGDRRNPNTAGPTFWSVNRPPGAAGAWSSGPFRMVHVVPDLLLGKVEKAGKDDQKHEHLEAEPLALVELGLRRPHQEGGNVLGVLIHRRRCAVGVFDLPVAERFRHRDSVARKVFV